MNNYITEKHQTKIREFFGHPSALSWMIGSLIICFVIGYFNDVIWGVFSIGVWFILNAIIYGAYSEDEVCDDDDDMM